MRKFVSALLLIFIFISYSVVMAEEFEVPKNYELNSVEAYADLEDEVIQACDWLIKHDFQSNEAKQKEVARFFMLWIIGSPNVSVMLNEYFLVSNPKMKEASMIVMAGWTKYALESRDFKNNIAGSLAGIQALINHYNIVKEHVGTDKKIEEFIKLNKENKLKDFVLEVFKNIEKLKSVE